MSVSGNANLHIFGNPKLRTFRQRVERCITMWARPHVGAERCTTWKRRCCCIIWSKGCRRPSWRGDSSSAVGRSTTGSSLASWIGSCARATKRTLPLRLKSACSYRVAGGNPAASRVAHCARTIQWVLIRPPPAVPAFLPRNGSRLSANPARQYVDRLAPVQYRLLNLVGSAFPQ